MLEWDHEKHTDIPRAGRPLSHHPPRGTPVEHQASYRLRGMDPDDMWSLIWSFDTIEAAEKCLVDCNEHKASFQTYALKDAGQEEFIERHGWF